MTPPPPATTSERSTLKVFSARKETSLVTMVTGRTSSVGDCLEVSNLSASNHSFYSQRETLPSCYFRSVSYVHVMETLKQALPPENLRHNMTVYKNCFRGDDAIKAFQVYFAEEIHNEKAAIAFGRTLQRARLLHHVADTKKGFRAGNFFFQLQCYQQPEVLNTYRVCTEMCVGDPMEVLEGISSLMLGVEKDITVNKSELLDFRVASKSPGFPFLEDALCQLQGLDPGELTEMTRVAISLNIYNIMAKFAFMKVGAPVTRGERKVFFTGLKFNVGGDLLSLDDLEHGILRGNRPPYGSTKSTYFAADDPRARLVPSRVDPRIHFAIRCSPMAPGKTEMVYPHTFHYDLQRVSRKYLSNHANFVIDPENNEVFLNQIFQWYGSDFFFRGSHDWPRLARFLLVNIQAPSLRQAVQSMIALSDEKSPRISYIPFDWGTRARNFSQFKPSDIQATEKRVMPRA